MDINRAARAPRGRTLRLLPDGGVDRLVLGGWPFHRHLHRGRAVAQKVRTRRSRPLAHRLRSGRDSSTAFGNARHGNDARWNPSDISGFYNGPLGAALLLPAVRRWAAAKLATLARSSRRAPRDDRVIELEPGEWHQIPDRGRRRQRKSKRGA